MRIFFSKEHIHEKKRGNTQELIEKILQFIVTSTSCEHSFFKRTYTKKREEIHTKDGKSSRTCRATHIHWEQKASEFFQWHIEGFPSKDDVNFVQLDSYTAEL